MACENNCACMTRREALATITMGSAALLTGCAGARQMAPGADHPSAAAGEPVMTNQTALAGNHQVVPLPFAAGSLTGISERMISSHHENNYGGAVRNLNRVEQELSQITADTPPFVVAALRERELTFRNSKTLHEAYFKNLGGDGKRSGAIDAAVGQAYGTTARWEQHFKSTALGLGGGSGWAILALELETGALRTFASGHHTQVLALSVPLLVLDLYEHSYQIDYCAAVARYFDAFVANVSWDEVNRRFERAQRLAATLAGLPRQQAATRHRLSRVGLERST
jgi:superoxide dismutase, Fe-Mn family